MRWWSLRNGDVSVAFDVAEHDVDIIGRNDSLRSSPGIAVG